MQQPGQVEVKLSQDLRTESSGQSGLVPRARKTAELIAKEEVLG